MRSVLVSRHAPLVVLLLAGCGSSSEAPREPTPAPRFDAARDDSSEPRAEVRAPEPRLSLRASTSDAPTSIELTPLGRIDLPVGGRARPIGPIFAAHVAPGDRRLELSLRPEAALPEEGGLPEGLSLVWLQERRDGSVEEVVLPTELRDRTWTATLDEAPLDLMRAFVFLAFPPDEDPQLKLACQLELSPEAFAAQSARCGTEQLEITERVLQGLCESGVEVDTARFELAMAELPCRPTPTDLDALRTEVSR
jgi:hypothetical protein